MPEQVAPPPAQGTCLLCGATFAKRGLTRHLASCRAKHPSEAGVPAERMLHLLIEDQYLADYYLHIEVTAKATFGQLDGFLRTIWLECCGHLSGFQFPEPRRPVVPDFSGARTIEELLALARQRMAEAGPVDDDEGSFDEQLGQRLQVGSEFGYDYDYGTTTRLCLRVIADETSVPRGAGVYLMARNNPPEILCVECGKPATQLCTECVWDGWGMLCGVCAPKHECGVEMLLPLVNSPRAGLCAYDGPATWENTPVTPSKGKTRSKPSKGQRSH